MLFRDNVETCKIKTNMQLLYLVLCLQGDVAEGVVSVLG